MKLISQLDHLNLENQEKTDELFVSISKNSKVDLMHVVEVQEKASRRGSRKSSRKGSRKSSRKGSRKSSKKSSRKVFKKNLQKDSEITLKKMISTEMHLNMFQLQVNQLAIFIMIHLSII